MCECVCVWLSQVHRLCDPMGYSPPNFSVCGIFQARILEWLAFPFSRRSSWPRDQTQVSCIAGGFFTITYHCPRGNQPHSCTISMLPSVWTSEEWDKSLVQSPLGKRTNCSGFPCSLITSEKDWYDARERKVVGLKGMLKMDKGMGLPWGLRKYRIHLQCRRPGFNP